MISTLLLLNLLFSNVVFATGKLIVNDESSKLAYVVGEEIDIEGICTANTDVVLRVYDSKKSLILTDTVPASQTSDGSYHFKGITIPQTNTSQAVTYSAVISSVGSESVTKTITVKDGTTPNKHTGGGGGGGGGGGSVTPTVKWTDEVEYVIDKIDTIETEKDAEKAIDDITKKTDEDDLKTEHTRHTIATATEKMAANLSAKFIDASSNKLNVNNKTISTADLNKVENTMSALKAVLKKSNLELNRELFKELVLNVKFDSSKKATIVISKEIITLLEKIDILTISDSNFKVSYQISDLITMLGNEEQIEVDITQPIVASNNKDIVSQDGSVAKINVTFNTNKTNSVKVSFDGIKGDTTYMAVVDEQGNPVGGKYNPATNCIEAKISASGDYTVVYNKKDFEDIKTKSKDMQDAIKKLASVGVIEGTSEKKFTPDDSISRAELAALVLRVVNKIDPNADGKFTDVKKSDWYFSIAGSSKQQGIIKGFEDNTFRANVTITKEQILAISARLLKTEMRYITPKNLEEYLTYTDSADISNWAKEDIALASMADLVIKSTDNKLNSNSDMTRGDAALIVIKLFEKIW